MSREKVCDTHLATRFLNEGLDAEAERAFLAHLEECESCRQELESAAANGRFWNETVQQLGQNSGDHIDPDFHPQTSDFAHNDDAADHLSIRNVIAALSPTDDPRMLGRVGEYEISGIVGFGGMGAVLKGFDKSLLRVVAIKVMAPHLANKGSARKRFEREARAAAAISHDNVIDIYRVDELNGLPYLVMPFARGPSLQKRIDEDGPLSTIDTVLVGKQIASGLAAAHDQGLVHRDIKPANILLNDGVERILITDFGVARAMDDASMTQTGLIAGTPQFMSPEQARGEIVDQRSDLFSLGALLYTACTGRPPFRADAPFGVLRKITDEDPRSILELNPEIPTWLVAVIDRLLEKDPANRFEDAKEVASVFEKCLAHLRQPNQIALPRTVASLQLRSATKTQSQPKRSFASNLGIALMVLAMGIVAVFAYLQITDAPQIAGRWSGEQWGDIKLQSVREADDWYTGSFEDASGNRGAIHLEWSRLGRRFKGRWSTGPDKSGSIVLRHGDSGSLRGAISFDAESAPAENELRLRDFLWKLDAGVEPEDGVAVSHGLPPANRAVLPQDRTPLPAPDPLFEIMAARSGTVGRVAEGLEVGKTVAEGEFLFELTSESTRNFDSQIAALKTKLKATRAKAAAYQQNIAAFSEAKGYSVESARELVEATKAKLVSLQKQAAGFEAKEMQARLDYERQRNLHEQGLKPAKELEILEKAWDVAKADLQSARGNADAKQKEVASREMDMAQKSLVAQTKIDNAEAMYQSALGEVATVQKEIADLEARNTETSPLVILAPVKGSIERIYVREGMSVANGQKMIEIRDEAVQKAPLIDQQFNMGSGEIGLGSIPEILTFVSGLQARMESSNRRVAELVRQIEQRETEIERSKKKVARLEKELADSDAENESTQSGEAELLNEREELRRIEQWLKKHIRDQRVEKTKLANVTRELETMRGVLELELNSAYNEVSRAKEQVKLRRARYEQGDANYEDLLSAESKLAECMAKAEKIGRLVEHLEDE